MRVVLDKDDLSSPEIGPRGVDFCVYLSNACDSHLDEVMFAWTNDESETTIKIKFTASDLVESAVLGKELLSRPGVMESESRQIFAAMRSDFEKAIREIDALEYE